METNDQHQHILASLIEPMGVSSLFFVARLFVDLSAIPDQILSCLDKVHLIVDAINICFNTEHSVRTVRTLCNLLAIHWDFVNDVLLLNEYNMLLNRLATSNEYLPAMNYIHSTSLLPFTNVCIDCHGPLSHYLSKAIRIICKQTVTNGLSITAICNRCSLRYGHSSVESMHQQTRRVTVPSMNSPVQVFFLTDTIAFTHSVLHDFTLSLLHSYAAFNGFTCTIIQHIARTQPTQRDFIPLDSLTKRFQTHWMLWQLIHFEFMLGNSSIVSMPSSLDRIAIDDHFEMSSGWWYHLFTVFWSRHACVPSIQCNPTICSRVVITDGHQKTRRLVCQFSEMVDTSIVEMGPIQTGCPLAPLRRTKKSPNGKYRQTIICHSREEWRIISWRAASDRSLERRKSALPSSR